MRGVWRLFTLESKRLEIAVIWTHEERNSKRTTVTAAGSVPHLTKLNQTKVNILQLISFPRLITSERLPQVVSIWHALDHFNQSTHGFYARYLSLCILLGISFEYFPFPCTYNFPDEGPVVILLPSLLHTRPIYCHFLFSINFQKSDFNLTSLLFRHNYRCILWFLGNINFSLLAFV